ncbi:trypsin-like peptidase domain-containing protein [Winogradskyella ursingii]|uniref:trypsin-like peptidase domain-containing protein n=1 Tax=Winogradskyella ursingii TaxID=2686079 RepID=UPI0015CC0CB0|nr:trypsin-like peptidase domain-containing protein [Winogradskyella ursingii]
MKINYLLLLLGIFSYSVTAQDKEIEYPFAEPGTKVSRGVFGADDRKEVKDAHGYEDFVRATAVMIPKDKIYGDEVYGWSLSDRLKSQFGTDKFDDNVKYLDQPAIGSCTGFLIAPDMMVTAGHCINSMEDANSYVWVFDYTSESKFIDGMYLKFDPKNIYEVESIIASKLDDESKDDYAVLKLTRASERAPYRFRTSGGVLKNGAINTIGSPTGLPLKFSTNAVVVDTSPNNWFKSNIDSFPGNSGGPVFDQNGFIEGILVRGAVEYSDGSYTGDYKYDEDCDCVKTVQWNSVAFTAGCQAHKITSVPSNALIMAVYENMEYAIKNNLMDRFKSWSIYNWIFNHKYTKEKGRLEPLAIKHKSNEVLADILRHTSNEISDDEGRHFIDLTMSNNNGDALKILLENNVLADAGLNSTNTALQNAVIKNKTNMAELLLYHGADAKIKTKSGDNLLHLAAKKGNKTMAKLFVEKGVGAGDKNNDKNYPEKIAKKAGHKDLAKYLKNARKGRL